MNLLSYNILDGGTSGRGTRDGPERERLLWRVIPAAVDVVALVEADDAGFVERLAGRLNMDFIHARGNSHAAALLSRLPILRTVNHARLRPELEKSLLEATVLDPELGELAIGVVHLHARAYEADEDVRERELDVVLDAFAGHRRRNAPHLLCGDFNANAPYQRIDPARCKPKTRAAWEAQGGSLPRRVVQRLLDAGYVDTLHQFDREAAETQGTFSTEFCGQRVDYVFAFGIEPACITDAGIVSSSHAREASDHFPVFVEIETAAADPT